MGDSTEHDLSSGEEDHVEQSLPTQALNATDDDISPKNARKETAHIVEEKADTKNNADGEKTRSEKNDTKENEDGGKTMTANIEEDKESTKDDTQLLLTNSMSVLQEKKIHDRILNLWEKNRCLVSENLRGFIPLLPSEEFVLKNYEGARQELGADVTRARNRVQMEWESSANGVEIERSGNLFALFPL